MSKNKLFISILILLQACAINSEYKDPEVKLPKSWVKSNEEIKQLEVKSESNWWQSYKDPILDSLINEALTSNTDIQTAINNIAKAKANIALGNSDRLPSLDFKATGVRTQNSPQVPSQAGTKPTNLFTIGGNISYQTDLWGRLSNATKSAKAELLAAESTKDNIRLTITSEVAKSYFNIVSLSEQINLIKEKIEHQKQLYKIMEERHNVGAIDKEALLNAEANLNNLISQLPKLEQQYTEQDHYIKILLGKDPESFIEILEHASSINNLPIVPVTPNIIPSRLLAQRPDIKAAENKLISANAKIDIARAAYFPDLSLTSLIGGSSIDIDTIFKNSNTWNIAGSLTAPIFNFGKTKANIKIAEATRLNYLNDYQKTLRTAFSEVFNALAAQENNLVIYNQIKRNEDVAKEKEAISENRYRVGYSALTEVINAKESYFNAKIESIKAYQNRLNSSVDLFKAMGGFWSEKS